MKRLHRMQSDYSAVWDRYVRKTFPRIRASAAVDSKLHEPWRVLNTNDEVYNWPGDEWGDRDTVAPGIRQ